jgi:zinc protease
MRTGIIALTLALTGAEWSRAEVRAGAPQPVERFQLDNGLTVLVRPVQGAKEVALVVLYALGGDQDPEGRSGLAHLIEHVYVTAAAGSKKARMVEEYVKRYPAGWNAQTGDRYTVIATVFAEKDLDPELQDAAARMGDLRVAAADLDREKPRVDAELANMFGRIPMLAASNQARELLRPTPRAGRKGGVPEHIKSMTLEEVQDRWKRYYKPRNALLVIAGAVEPTTARKAIRRYFAGLPGGEAAPAPQEPGKARRGALREVTVQALQRQVGSELCLAYAAPAPTSDLYAPFLVLLVRMQSHAAKLEAGAGRFPVQFAPLDDPAVVCLSVPVKKGESANQAVARLEAFVAAALEPRFDKKEIASVKDRFGLLLGIADLPDRWLAGNPYGVAYALGRRHQLGMDSAKLGRALQAVTDEDVHRAAKAIFAPDRYAGAVISAEEE